MGLTKSQFKMLYDAFNEAFTTNESLEELAQMAHSETLDQIATGNSTKTKIQRMIEKAEAEHWLEDLLQVAFELRPRDERLCQLYQKFQTNPEEFERLEGDAQADAVCRFLEKIENDFKYVSIFHPLHKLHLKEQYIDIEVILKQRNECLSWKEAKECSDKIIVLGAPGLGKTTLLQREAFTTAQEEQQKLKKCEIGINDVILPLFLKLFDFADKREKDIFGAEIIDAIPRLIQRNYRKIFPQIAALLQEKLENGKCLLLLDGFDEIPKEHRSYILEKLNRFVRDYPSLIILTSRPDCYDSIFINGAQQVELAAFTQKQSEQYIENWFHNLEDAQEDSGSANGLIQELRNTPQMQGLVQNPLLLSLLCYLYQQRKLTLPTRKVRVYEHTIYYMLREWRNRHSRQQPEEGWIHAKIVLIEELAYHFKGKAKSVFTFRELYDSIETYFQRGDILTDLKSVTTTSLIDELTKEDGILQRLDGNGGQKRYTFVHPTFQEYLTASYLSRQKNGLEIAKAHFWDYDWHETITLFAGLLDGSVPLLKALVDAKDDIFSTLLLLAGRVAAECQEQTHEVIIDIANRIFTLWRSYSGLDFICASVTALSQTFKPLFEHLQAALHDKDNSLRMGAVGIFGKIGNRQAVEALIHALQHEQHKFIRGLILKALRAIGSPEAIEALDQEVEPLLPQVHHREAEMRKTAIWILGDIGTPKAIDLLIQAFDDEDKDVRVSAIVVLGNIGSVEAIHALAAAINHKNNDVKEIAISTLRNIGSIEAIEALTQNLYYEDSYIRRLVIAALGKIGTIAIGALTQKAIGALTQALYHADSDTRFIAVNILGEIPNLKAIEVLTQALHHEHSDVRIGAVISLGKLDNRQAVRILTRTLNRDDIMVRRMVILMLRIMSHPEAKKVLIQARNHENSEIREIATIPLEKLWDQEKLTLLTQKVLIDEKTKFRLNIAQFLANNSKSETIRILTQFLKNKDENVRGNTVEALQMIGTPEAVEVLTQAFEDNDRYVRLKAVMALQEIGSSEAIEVLNQALLHKDEDIKVMSTEALRKIGTVSTLENLIVHPDIDMYTPLIFFLARTLAERFSKEDKPFIPVYPELLNHKRPEFRVRPDLRQSQCDV